MPGRDSRHDLMYGRLQAFFDKLYFIPKPVKKLEKLFIAPKVRQVLYETSQRVFTRCACARRTGFLIKFLIKNQYQETLWMAEPFHAAWNASPRDSLTVGWGNTVWTSSSALASASMAEAARAIISVVWTPYR